MPSFSIAIPCYNRAHLIGDTIESVIRQDLSDWELIVVDDASTDDSVEVVKSYCAKERRIRLFLNNENLGLTRNWNRCLDLCKGQFISLLLSDDLVDSHYYSVVEGVFKDHPDVGIVASSCRYIDRNGDMIDGGREKENQHFKPGDQAVGAFLSTGFPHVSSVVFRAECVEQLGGFREDIWHGPDGEMDARIGKHFGYFRLGKVFTSFRRHGSNMGNLEYLREDFLKTDMLKKSLAWSYLSEAGRRKIGVVNLDKYLAHDAAQTALVGAIVSIAYGNAPNSRRYLRSAFQQDWRACLSRRGLKAVLIQVIPKIGRSILARRMGISDEDRRTIMAVANTRGGS